MNDIHSYVQLWASGLLQYGILEFATETNQNIDWKCSAWTQHISLFNGQHQQTNISACLLCVCIHVSSQPVCGGLSSSCSVVTSRLVWFSAISCSSLTSAPVFWAPSGTYVISTQHNAIQLIRRASSMIAAVQTCSVQVFPEGTKPHSQPWQCNAHSSRHKAMCALNI